MRNAHRYLQECKNKEVVANGYEVKRLLNPTSSLSNIGLLVQRELLTKYPREPTDKDKQRALMAEAKEEMEKEYQRMYGDDLMDTESLNNDKMLWKKSMKNLWNPARGKKLNNVDKFIILYAEYLRTLFPIQTKFN